MRSPTSIAHTTSPEPADGAPAREPVDGVRVTFIGIAVLAMGEDGFEKLHDIARPPDVVDEDPGAAA